MVASVGEGLYSHWQGKRWAEIDTVLARLSDHAPLHVSLTKTIGLLGVIGERQSLRASADVLEFAMTPTANAAEVGTALKELKKKSSIVFRRHSDSYGLWEGSNVNLDAAVRTARGRIGDKESLTQRGGGRTVRRGLGRTGPRDEETAAPASRTSGFPA